MFTLFGYLAVMAVIAGKDTQQRYIDPNGISTLLAVLAY